MWTSSDFQTYKKQFDFTSSEQGKPTFTALKVEDIEFFNLIEGLEGQIEEDQVFQTILCDHCGCYECESGNWISIRQFNYFIFFIPAFDRLQEDLDISKYQPPNFIRKNGAFWLPQKKYEEFKKLVPELDELKSVNVLEKKELINLYKWDTPHKMFGDFPNFNTIRIDHFLVVSELDNETIANLIETKLSELCECSAFDIALLNEKDEVVTIYLDDNKTTEWKALCKTGEIYFLLLGGTFKITASL